LPHASPSSLCQDCGAVYVAALVTAIADGGTPSSCHRAALAEAERSGADPEVRAALQAALSGPPADYVTQPGWVRIALHNAFYQLLHAPNVEEGVVDTIMRGGDTDTTAAIAGALLGAVHGRGQVPKRWVEVLLNCRPVPGAKTVHPRPEEFWPVDALELAGQLLSAGRAFS
jgi:ADP-ribosylglycohydrolase